MDQHCRIEGKRERKNLWGRKYPCLVPPSRDSQPTGPVQLTSWRIAVFRGDKLQQWREREWAPSERNYFKHRKADIFSRCDSDLKMKIGDGTLWKQISLFLTSAKCWSGAIPVNGYLNLGFKKPRARVKAAKLLHQRQSWPPHLWELQLVFSGAESTLNLVTQDLGSSSHCIWLGVH